MRIDHFSVCHRICHTTGLYTMHITTYIYLWKIGRSHAVQFTRMLEIVNAYRASVTVATQYRFVIIVASTIKRKKIILVRYIAIAFVLLLSKVRELEKTRRQKRRVKRKTIFILMLTIQTIGTFYVRPKAMLSFR